MFQNLFNPIDISELNSNAEFGKHTQYYHLDEFPDLSNTNIVIFNTIEHQSNFRKYLYQFSYHFNSLKIADLGVYNSSDYRELVPFILEMLEKGILPIIISSDLEINFPILSTLSIDKKTFSVAIIDSFLRANENNINKNHYLRIFQKFAHVLHDISNIGYQTHLNSESEISFYLDNELDAFRLGEIRKKINQIEPILRDKNFLLFNFSAFNNKEFNSDFSISSAGFSIDESAMLTYFGGESDLCKIFSLTTSNVETPCQIEDQNLAILIWYFLEGVENRRNDYPLSTENMIKYIVNVSSQDQEIVFWKSNKSEKWWIEVIKINEDKKYRRLVPCSYEDYLSARNNLIPERFFSSLSK